MIDGMEVTKTYPPEIEAPRTFALAQIEEAKARLEAKLSSAGPATATAISQRPRDHQELLADYHAEVEPWVQQLVRFEAMATMTVVLPAGHI